MNEVSPFPGKPRIDIAILSAYSQPVFDRMARRYAFGPRGWLLQNMVGMAIAFLMFAGGCGILATAAKQPVLQAFGTEAVGTVRNVSFRTEKFHPMAKWEAIDYVFETRQGKTVEVRLDRPVQEWSGVSFSHLIVDYWDRFPGINAPRGIHRSGAFAVGLGLFFLLCSFHFVCFVRRRIRWRRGLMAASAAIGLDQRG